MGNMLLRDGDANGMAHSLEIRVPLLDQRLLDYALSIPGSVRLPAGGAQNICCARRFPNCFARPFSARASAALSFRCAAGCWGRCASFARAACKR